MMSLYPDQGYYDQQWANITTQGAQKQAQTAHEVGGMTAMYQRAVNDAQRAVQQAQANYEQAVGTLALHDRTLRRDHTWANKRQELAGQVESWRVAVEQSRTALQQAHARLEEAQTQGQHSLALNALGRYKALKREVDAETQAAYQQYERVLDAGQLRLKEIAQELNRLGVSAIGL